MWKCFFDVIIWHLLEADKIQSIQRTKVKDFIDIIILIALILWLNYLKKKIPWPWCDVLSLFILFYGLHSVSFLE